MVLLDERGYVRDWVVPATIVALAFGTAGFLYWFSHHQDIVTWE